MCKNIQRVQVVTNSGKRLPVEVIKGVASFNTKAGESYQVTF